MIRPTVGRVVWFYFAGENRDKCQPLAALVAYVHEGETLVNLSVADASGDHFPKTKVPLIQEGNEPPKGEFCCWMPYQQGQAKSPPADELVKRIRALEDEVAITKDLLKQVLGEKESVKSAASSPSSSVPGNTTAYTPPGIK